MIIITSLARDDCRNLAQHTSEVQMGRDTDGTRYGTTRDGVKAHRANEEGRDVCPALARVDCCAFVLITNVLQKPFGWNLAAETLLARFAVDRGGHGLELGSNRPDIEEEARLSIRRSALCPP
jgi:hypothetical protein